MSSENQEVAVPVEQPSVLSGDPKTETPQATTDWKASLSEEVRSDKSLENIKDIEGLAKSYVHAQKMVGSDKIPVPNKYATDKDWDAVYEKLGRPKSADGYKYDLPQDKQVDEASLKEFSSQAHKLGLLPTQANGVVKFYNEMTAKSIQDADSKALAARENSTKELKQEWGQAFDQKINQAATLAKSVGATELFDTNLADGTKLGDHPVMIKAFAELANKMGEDTITQASGPAYLTPNQIEKQIGELTQPGSAYWDKNHMNHQAAVQEVLALREKKNQV
tara:strand:- start:186 stop:1022 length:837 start_codon:yes stop_codon:yes gene_type:complete